MTATAALGFLVVHTPSGEDYFCAEPVSNCTDAFNLVHTRADTGMLVRGSDALAAKFKA